MKRTSIAVLAVTLLAYNSAQAGGHGGKGRGERPDFATVDTDGSGGLSYEEMSAGPRGAPPQDRFAQLDADGNGEVSKDEIRNMRSQHGGPPSSAGQ